MLVIGLTGGIGSGKSTVASLFQKKGISVINADILAREVVTPGSDALAQIASHFGNDILDTDGALKRSDLRKRVFENSQERRWLENLLHPLIAERVASSIKACNSAYCILESPLLLETDQYKWVNRILVVDVTQQTQLHRTLLRDNSDEKTVRAIIASQISREKRLQRADDVINNELPKESVQQEVDRLHAAYLNLAEAAL